MSDNGGSVTVFDGDYNDLSNTPTIPTTTSDLTNNSGFLTTEVDGSTTNEIQILSISNDTIFLSGGGFAKLPASQGFDGDYNSLSNTPTIPSNTSDLTNNSGFLTSEVDGSITNEIQTISKTGSAITLSDSGGSVTIFDGDYSDLSNTPTIPVNTSDLTNDSGFLTTELDGSTTNELQVLSLLNDTIYLSNGGKIYSHDLGAEYSISSGTTGANTGWIISLERNGVVQSDFFRVSPGAGIALSGNNSTDYQISNLSNDLDSTNEIQDLQDVLSESNDASNKAVFNIKRQSIGQLALDTSAVLDVVSTTQGFLPPRMTEAQRDAIHLPAAGLILWCTDCGSNGEIQVFNGTAYTNMSGGAESVSTPFTNITQLVPDIDGEGADDYSGWSVSLSSDGSTLAIGAIGNDANGSNSGHVRVFEYDNGTWTQLGADIDGEALGDESGYSVSLSSDGSILAIGANRNDENGSASGHVRVFEYYSTSWTQIGSDIDGEAADDYSGYSVSLSADGTILAIGAYTNDGNGTYAGHVRVYRYLYAAWTRLGRDIDGEAAGDYSGTSVSLSSDGTIIAIGAKNNSGSGSAAGHVRVYR